MPAETPGPSARHQQRQPTSHFWSLNQHPLELQLAERALCFPRHPAGAWSPLETAWGQLRLFTCALRTLGCDFIVPCPPLASLPASGNCSSSWCRLSSEQEFHTSGAQQAGAQQDGMEKDSGQLLTISNRAGAPEGPDGSAATSAGARCLNVQIQKQMLITLHSQDVISSYSSWRL